MKKLKIIFLLLSLFILINVSCPIPRAKAQCAMCTLSAQNSTHSKIRKQGLGLNDAILLLFFTPYAIFGVIGYMWYKKSRKGDIQ